MQRQTDRQRGDRDREGDNERVCDQIEKKKERQK